MKRIVISAYAVSPIRGSECSVGWEITKRLGKYFDVTVLICNETPSKKKYYEEIIDYINKNGEIINVKYIPIKMPPRSRFYTWLHDHGFWPAYYWGYKAWQKDVYKKAFVLHKEKAFNIAYQLNMIGFREPGYLWKLNIPFVWGPTNGFHSIPFSFIKHFSGKEYLFQLLKHIANEAQIRLAYRARRAARKASVVWCVDNAAYQKMKRWSNNAALMQETGLTTIPNELHTVRTYDGKRTLNIVCSGMITTGKAHFILIDALLKLKKRNFHLYFFGDGPLKESLIKKSESIKDKITWYGWLDRNTVLEKINKSDLLIHPSLKEATSMTILEALGNGVPVICHDTCGMGIVVNDKNGFKIPYINAEFSTFYLTNLIDSFFENPNKLNNKYSSIVGSLGNLTWDSKIELIMNKLNKISQ